MDVEILRIVFLNTAAAVLPWVLGGLVLLGAVSFSPLGRLWVGYLRERRRDSEAPEAMLAETTALRSVLGEVVERLDATERRLALSPLSSPPRNELDNPGRTSTPV